LDIGLIVVRYGDLRGPVALAPAANSSQTVADIFELRLKSPMNLVGRDVFSVEKSNDRSLLRVHSAR
jgi:cbb3-type cytochrome oxidase cytochrome c subunit